MSDKRIRIRMGDSGVAIVTMVRADKHNALDKAMFEGLLEAADRLATDRTVRAVVLHGEGRSFCSGLDISSFLADSAGGIDALFVREDGRLANFAQRAAYDWSRVPVPVIAAITGNCFGGGLQIALGADIRIAAPDARLSLMEVKWGLVPDMAITQSLPGVMRVDVAKELTFTGRIVSGLEARSLGLVTRTADDPLTAALELADDIAEKSPDAIRAAKRLYDETWSGGDTAGALALESRLQLGLLGTPNQVAAVAAGVSGRAASFIDPE
ncbi:MULTISPECIES: crotonase/enoyl-CoA hydratase family protein [Rhodococcus]|uniref:Crotonase/enoyl-CoA hydratase family protein n=1 Tax=Rhodococcus oxybenzonivorans TaxID=1990687 RepID=A0AAE4UWP8_9NOCA|nr:MULTISPECIES: crotonase/enoyl-CoA hydratase family protein [Rhodococcus]MDV7241560.1 crotonase/enoyl-CoA hydratase family protein [Rhodococcus oxybenzonivorans]MDV7264145.1 crotonase/enoyl-CoA hydratase family protein [Rhodococcus oxybenzonivorans]MDV7273907.1 crotonase/enoyl-CoA hydratase family protein [Rhodococcus oxybenzonivorans]MDV7333841.1 crotonase/enoyl-CoA hydratase family protein [Rhodococcus oxybenzonivorans]MDV7343260.1 crotonase/enoyl-CoA hydratase family protein [Rhodococcus 